MHRQDASKTYPVTYPKNVTPKCAFWLPLKLSLSDISVGGAWASPGTYIYMYTCCYKDWIGTLVTNISYLLWHLNGSLTCPPAVPHRHALYGSREVTDMRQLCTASNPNPPTHAALGTLYEACRGFVSYRF